MRAKSNRAAREHQARIDRLRRTSHGPERCQWPWGCASEAVDAHESLNRSQGGDPTDPDWLLCRPHHDSVTSAHGPARARYVEAGLIRTAASERIQTASPAVTVTDMPSARKALTIRVSDSAAEWVAERMAETTASQSVVVRAMLSVATQHPDEVRAKVRAMTE